MTVCLALRRAALGALLVTMTAMAMTSAWPSCDPGEPAPGEDVGTGATFGAEITVRIVGRGRVTSTPAGIDCPSSCFMRVLVADPSVDGGDGGIPLLALENDGTRFVGWTLEELDLGVRARGPSQCSPMTRKSTMLSLDSVRDVSVPFGETTGTPPRGREEECAAFTKVPVAYAITATFEESFVPPIPEAGPFDAGPEPLFQPAGNGPAKEIGLSGGYVYWRYEQNGRSGIASAFPGSNQVDIVVSPFDTITRFDVDAHVVFQHESGILHAVRSGEAFVVTLGNAPTCAALASDFANVYCRADGPSSSTLYSWPISGAASPTIVHVLPPGRDLAVDNQRFYFSDDKGGFTDQAVLSSAPRAGDGGVALTTALLANQTSPRDLTLSSTYLFWIDDRGGGVSSARSGYKLAAGSSLSSLDGSNVRFIAAEPFGSSYWVGTVGAGGAGGAIYRAFAGSSSNALFRSGLTGLGGIAVDSSYVYWTQSDGRVYRASTIDAQL